MGWDGGRVARGWEVVFQVLSARVLWVCMYVCMYVRFVKFVCVYLWRDVCVHVDVYIYVFVHVNVRSVCMYACMCMYAGLCV